MKITILKFTFLTAMLCILFSSCKVKGKGYLYTESSIQPQDVKGRSVAILPNRLPVTLQNPEKWRVNNFETMKKILVSKGFSVIDYNTSNQLFQQSGLPLEDTKSSRDKYAELAQKMNADILIFPYYGTTFNSTGFSNSYISIASLQFYNLQYNDFSARVDLEGVTKIQTWPELVPVVGLVWQVLTLGPKKKGHSKAFARGMKEGFEVYFSRFSGASSSGSGMMNNSNNSNSNNTTNFNNNSNGNNKPTGTAKYSKYSVTELETLKKAAAANGDYKTAGELKEEIEKRNKK